MPTTPSIPLLMRAPLADLRAKLHHPSPVLAPLWRHALTQARRDGEWFTPYTVLAAIVTGEAEDRARARAAILRLVDLLPEGEQNQEAQFHTHVLAAPLGRWVVYYDWLADEGVFTAAEQERIQAALVDHCWVFAQQHVESRAQFFDNQILSNAFASATIGYVCGIKRGNSALARRLFASGMERMMSIYRHLTPSGYSLEGSTYHQEVVVPLVGLTGMLIQQLAGIDAFTHGIAPSNVPLQRVLDVGWKMMGPSGLSPAWDAYGFQPAIIKSGLALLADLTRNPAPLESLLDLGMWYRNNLAAWEHDDRLWALVWWPADLQPKPGRARFPAWMSPTIGGALQDARTTTRLFQYWDETGGIPHAGRCQVDPNAVTLESHGSPLLVDGLGARLSAELLPVPTETILEYAGKRPFQSHIDYIRATWGGTISFEHAVQSGMDGSVGMSNALVFDDETWYIPLAPRHGTGLALHAAGPLQAIRSDATAYYTDRYDVTRVERASLLVNGEYVLTCDLVAATSPHRVTWQAYMRRDVSLAADGGGAVVHSPEQVRCDVRFGQTGATRLDPTPGYPRIFPGTARLQHTTGEMATAHRLDAALLPQSMVKPAVDLNGGWTRRVGGNPDATVDVMTVDLRDAYLTDPGGDLDRPRVYERRFTVEFPLADRMWFSLHTVGPGTQVLLNEHRLTATDPEPERKYFRTGSLLTAWYDVTGHLLAGKHANTLRIISPSFHGETVRGPAILHGAQPVTPASVVRRGVDAFAVSIGGRIDEVLIAREPLPPGSAGDASGDRDAARWIDGSTDARFAVRIGGAGNVAVAAATSLRLPSNHDLRLHADAPCDLAWSPDETRVTAMPEGCRLDLAWTDGHLTVELGACVSVTWVSGAKHHLLLHLPTRRSLIVNGEFQTDFAYANGVASLHLAGQTATQPADAPVALSVEGLYAAVERHGHEASPQVLAALQSTDWRVQMAGADLAGRLNLAAAGDLLLDLFRREGEDLPYPPIRRWWRFSRMMRDGDRDEGIDPELPLPVGIKRWRVRRACVTALGLIGERRAIQPIAAAVAASQDFFPVTSQMPVALGRLGAVECIPLLENNANHAEVNTKIHCRLALALLRGEIDRTTFESRIGKG